MGPLFLTSLDKQGRDLAEATTRKSIATRPSVDDDVVKNNIHENPSQAAWACFNMPPPGAVAQRQFHARLEAKQMIQI